MQALVKVIRSSPRPRDRFEGISGVLNASIRTCSAAAGDPLDSYLHVGAGTLRLSMEKEYVEQLLTHAELRRDLERVVEDLESKISLDYSEFAGTREGPVIPGNSVKGNVRSRLELSFVPKGDFIRSCLIVSGSSPPGWEEHTHFKLWRSSLSFSREGPCSYTKGLGGVCLLCDLFGTAGLQSLIQFSDFVGKNVNLHPINLPTGERFLAAPPGSTFTGKIVFRNLKAPELGLLLYGMGIRNSKLGKPVLLGRMKYRRDLPYTFGIVRYSVDSLFIAPFSQQLEVNDLKIQPGRLISGVELDGLSSGLISLVQREFSNELVDVNEVGI